MHAHPGSTRASGRITLAVPATYRSIGILLALGGVVAFSLRPVLVKLCYRYGVDAVTLLALRMVFSLPLFMAAILWARAGRPREPIARRDWLAIVALGFIGYYLASFLDFLGLQHISAGLGRLLLFAYPTFVVLLSAAFLRKPVRARDAVALALTYGGVALVLWRSVGEPGSNVLLGAGLVIASALFYAIYLVAGSQVVKRVGSLRFTAYATSVAAVCGIVQFLAMRPLSALDLPSEVYWIALAMGVFCTAIPVFMTSEALDRVGANHVAMIGSLGPVTTVLFGYLGLDERMTRLQVAGGALVLAGVLLVSLNPRR